MSTDEDSDEDNDASDAEAAASERPSDTSGDEQPPAAENAGATGSASSTSQPKAVPGAVAAASVAETAGASPSATSAPVAIPGREATRTPPGSANEAAQHGSSAPKPGVSPTAIPLPDELVGSPSSSLTLISKSRLTKKKGKRGKRASKDTTLLHEITLPNGQLVMWVSESDVRLCTGTLASVSVKAALSLSRTISRGYSSVRRNVEDATGETGEFHCACGAATRLILVVHGIGQAMDRTVSHEQGKGVGGDGERQGDGGGKKERRGSETLPVRTSFVTSFSRFTVSSQASFTRHSHLLSFTLSHVVCSPSTQAENNAYTVRNMLNHLCRSGAMGPRFKSGAERFEVLPVNWRTTLALNHETVGDITPPGLDLVRAVLNNVALDVLYFTSPRYSQEIIDTVTDKMNAVYVEFVRRNPEFTRRKGIVSLYAHSLGGVISYEILLNQKDAVDLADDEEEVRVEAARINELQAELDSIHARQRRRDLSRQQQQERRKAKEAEQTAAKGAAGQTPRKARRKSLNSLDVRKGKATRTSSLSLELAEVDELPGGDEDDVFGAKKLHNQPVVYSKLKFRVAHLFAAGSPMAIFLTLRGASSRPEVGCHGPEGLLPPGTRVFNCFHSVDPLAYRMEPLLVEPDRVQEPVSVEAWPPSKPFMDRAFALGRFFTGFASGKKKEAADDSGDDAEGSETEEKKAWKKQARKALEERAPKGGLLTALAWGRVVCGCGWCVCEVLLR